MYPYFFDLWINCLRTKYRLVLPQIQCPVNGTDFYTIHIPITTTYHEKYVLLTRSFHILCTHVRSRIWWIRILLGQSTVIFFGLTQFSRLLFFINFLSLCAFYQAETCTFFIPLENITHYIIFIIFLNTNNAHTMYIISLYISHIRLENVYNTIAKRFREQIL